MLFIYKDSSDNSIADRIKALNLQVPETDEQELANIKAIMPILNDSSAESLFDITWRAGLLEHLAKANTVGELLL